MNLKGIKSKDLESFSESVYEHLSQLFIFLSSLLASVTVGWLAFLIYISAGYILVSFNLM